MNIGKSLALSLFPFHQFIISVLLDKVLTFLCLILLTCKMVIIVPIYIIYCRVINYDNLIA